MKSNLVATEAANERLFTQIHLTVVIAILIYIPFFFLTGATFSAKFLTVSLLVLNPLILVSSRTGYSGFARMLLLFTCNLDAFVCSLGIGHRGMIQLYCLPFMALSLFLFRGRSRNYMVSGGIFAIVTGALITTQAFLSLVGEPHVKYFSDAGLSLFDFFGSVLLMSVFLYLFVRDNTEKEKARAERDRLISILDTSPDFIGIADMKGNLKYHNRAAKAFVGLPENTDLSALKIKDMHPEWAGKLVEKEGIPVVLTGKAWRKETALLHADGHEIPVSQILMLHRNEQGEPEYLSTIMRDMTQSHRRVHQDALAQKIDQFLATSTSEKEIIKFTCRSVTEHLKWLGGIFWVYNSKEEKFEFSDSYAGVDISIQGFVQSARATFFSKEKGLLKEILRTGDVVSQPEIGENSTLHGAFGFPICLDDQSMGCFEFLHNTKETPDPYLIELFRELHKRIGQRIQYLRSKVEADERLSILQAIIDGFPSPLVVKDLEGRFMFANKALAESLNVALDKLLGRPLTDFVSKDVAAISNAEDQQVIQTQSSIALEKSVDRNGLTLSYLVSKFPLRNLNGEITSVAAVTTDITNQMELTKQWRDAEVRARAASKAKDQFLASMSHEIRTPLNGVIGMTDLLFETTLSSEQREYAKIIQQSGNTLLSLINDILDFSKIEAGRMELEKVEFSVSQLIEGQSDILFAKAKEKNVVLSTFSSPSLPDLLMGDPGRLGQILLNLVGNALKFTASGGVSVRALKRRFQGSSSSDITWVRFEVEDTGIGLTDFAIGRLFQPFSQADETISRKYGGTGLGLSICKRLVDAMGGLIGVESVKDKGALFWFEVPLQATKQLHETRPAKQSASLFGLKAFVIDEDKITRETFFLYFDSWGMQVSSAASVEDALKKIDPAAATTDPYRMVLVGAGLVLNKGFEIGQQLKQQLKDKCPDLILVTEFGQNVSRDVLKKNGFAGYIHKPIKQSQLADCLVKVLHPELEGLEGSKEKVVEDAVGHDESSKRRILVAEDVAANQMLARKLLEGLGYSVTIAANGIEAVEALKTLHFDLVLMDCQMPELDGYEATKQIRLLEDAEKRGVPIIALTANALSGDDKKCIAAGMDDYLSKPIKKDVLKAKLDKWLMNIERNSKKIKAA